MSLDRLAYKIECVSVLAGTSRQYSPDAFAPGSALFAASALRNIAVYDNKANRLFSEIIGRFNARRGNKLEISIAVFTETIGKILSLTTVWNINQRRTGTAMPAFGKPSTLRPTLTDEEIESVVTFLRSLEASS